MALNQTLYFNPEVDGTIEQWLETHRLSQIRQWCKYIVVPHPNQVNNHQVAMKKYYYKDMSPMLPPGFDVYIADHEELISAAMENGILDGYWFFFCDMAELDLYWQTLVLGLYRQPHLRYSRVVCCPKEADKGIIFVCNEDFTNTADVIKLVEMCKALLVGLPVRTIKYKPAFYWKVGKNYREGAATKYYIYSTSTRVNDELYIEDGVNEMMNRVI